jgi:hypothetical protein
MRTWSKCLQQRRNIGKCLSSCHLNKQNLINSLRANLDERTFSSDDALKALPPKISPFLQEGLFFLPRLQLRILGLQCRQLLGLCTKLPLLVLQLVQ